VRELNPNRTARSAERQRRIDRTAESQLPCRARSFNTAIANDNIHFSDGDTSVSESSAAL